MHSVPGPGRVGAKPGDRCKLAPPHPATARANAPYTVGNAAAATVNDDDISPPPESLVASDLAHDALTLSWNAPAGLAASGYQVLVRYPDTDRAGQFAVLVENTVWSARARLRGTAGVRRR